MVIREMCPRCGSPKYKRNGRFQLIVWLSARRRRFEEGKIVTINSPDFTSIEEAVDRLLVEYGALDDDFKKSLAEKKKLLLDYLNAYPAFIVADDIDALLEDDDVVSLFTHEIPHTQSAVLLTSRRAIPGIRSFVVKGFETNDAEQFVHSRVELYGLDATPFTPAIVAEIAKVTDGSPLYMDDLIRLTQIVEVQKAIAAWTERGGDAARRYALQREMEKLSSDAKEVLVAAAISEEGVSLAELEHVLAFSEERLQAALSELQTLFLFPKPKVVEGEQRFEINLNTKNLVRVVEGKSDGYARIERKSQALRGQLPEAGPGTVGALIRQAQLRLNAGRTQEAEGILVEAIEKYPQSADLRSFLGYAYKRMGRIAEARKQFETAFKLKGKKREMFLQWVWMEIAEKEWSKAISAADRALKTIPGSYEMLELKVYGRVCLSCG
jgi:tetratricopeptide (TPR) repeat protein